MMSTQTTPQTPAQLEKISALVDGACQSADEAAQALRLAADDAQARERWHLYHLVGDVMRSADLAAAAAHHAPLLERLRAGMAADAGHRPPQAAQTVQVAQTAQVIQVGVPLPPAAAPSAAAASALPLPAAHAQAANDGVFRWKMVAGLASFAAVAVVAWGVWGVWGVSGGGQSAADAPLLARSGTPAMPAAHVGAPASVAGHAFVDAPTAVAQAGQGASALPVMMRDARLDELLAEHRHASGASALSNEAGFLRHVTFEREPR